MRDPFCPDEVPSHLHTLGRQSVSFHADERLYRRYIENDRERNVELSSHFKFQSNQSSTNRSGFSAPGDVLIDCQTGSTYQDFGVLSVPVSIFAVIGELTVNSDVYTITTIHDPLRCNYAHSDFVVRKNGEIVSKIKPGSIKDRIRELIEPEIRTEIPSRPPASLEGDGR